MKTSDNGIKVMHFYEKCVLFAYPDPASPMAKQIIAQGGWYKALASRDVMQSYIQKYAAFSGAPWTIGWGNTGPDVKPGVVWSQDKADSTFESRLAKEFEPAVSRNLKRTPTQAQFDGMVCFTYNLGEGNFASSTLLKNFNKGEIDKAADNFLDWIMANKVKALGLYRRRTSERLVFLGSDAESAIAEGQAITVLP